MPMVRIVFLPSRKPIVSMGRLWLFRAADAIAVCKVVVCIGILFVAALAVMPMVRIVFLPSRKPIVSMGRLWLFRAADAIAVCKVMVCKFAVFEGLLALFATLARVVVNGFLRASSSRFQILILYDLFIVLMYVMRIASLIVALVVILLIAAASGKYKR